MKKRILSLLLALLMVLSVVPATAFAEDASAENTEAAAPTTQTIITDTVFEIVEDPVTEEIPETTVETVAESTPQIITDPVYEIVTEAADETEAAETADYSSSVGMYGVFDTDYWTYFIISADPTQNTEENWADIQFTAEEVPADLTLVIMDWMMDSGNRLWYKVEAADGCTLPDALAVNPWVFQDYTDENSAGDSLILSETMPEGTDSATELTQTTASGNQVAVQGLLPKGTALSVQDVSVDAVEFGIADASRILAAMDIRLLSADGSEYQPYLEQKEVQVTINAAKLGLADGDVVRLHHKHDGEIKVYEPYIVIDGEITFWTDNFSIYAVEDDTAETGTEVPNGSTYQMTVGQIFDSTTGRRTQTFYSDGYNGQEYDQYEDNADYDKYYVWSISDPDGAINYTVRNIKLAGNIGIPDGIEYDARVAPWITVEPKKTGTVELTITTYYRKWLDQDLNHPGSAIDGGTQTFTIQVSEPEGFHIENRIAETGCLVPVGYENEPGVTYTWTRSDGNQIRLEALNDTGGINVAIDRGGVTNDADGKPNDPVTYTVTAKSADGAELGTASYEVLYGSEILNPSFEYPKGASNNWDAPWDNPYGYVTNGTPGLYWKTTTPGNTFNLGRDIEFGDANSPHYAVPADGEQYVELNAEGFGALYQDLLTTPGATLSWSFSHTARSGGNNNMYILMGATEHAQSIISYDNILDIITVAQDAEKAEKAKNPDKYDDYNTPIPKGGSGFEFTYNGEIFYIWNSFSNTTAKAPEQWIKIYGTYQVPESQYLTRLFFVSDPTKGDSTHGNLIDGVSAREELDYIIEYYEEKNIVVADTETGTQTPNTTVTLENLEKYLEKYEYPADIFVNGKDYPGTLEDLQNGLYITDYGPKTGTAAGYEEDIVVQIYFQVPNVIVTKIFDIEGWDKMAPTEQQALLDAGLSAEFELRDGTTTHQTDLTIHQLSPSGTLTAETSFPVTTDDYQKVFTVAETSATAIPNYALTTTYKTGYSRNSLAEGKEVKLKNEDGKKIVYVEVTNTYVKNTGDLCITKTVVGKDGYTTPDEEFTFTVSGDAVKENSYMVSIDHAAAVAYPVTDGKLTIKLKDNQSAIIKNLSLANYTVEEAPSIYYSTTPTGASGTINKDTMQIAKFTNTHIPRGDLKVTKYVDKAFPEDVDPEQKDFAFTLTMPTDAAKTSYDYSIYNGGEIANQNDDTEFQNGTLNVSNNTLTFTLQHNQYILIEDLPAGSGYTISEPTYSGFAPPSFSPSNSITIPDNDTAEVVCTNIFDRTTGTLEISKTVVNNTSATDIVPQDGFEFTVTLTSYPDTQLTVKIVKGETENAQTVDVNDGSFTIFLKDGEKAVLEGIPASGYTVKEKAYENFGTSWGTGGYSGMISGGSISKVECTNTYGETSGDLKITKKVKKQYDRDTVPDDTFTIQTVFTQTDSTPITGTFTYYIYDEGVTPHVGTGTVSSGGTLELKDGQFAIVKDLPRCNFQITETEATNGLENYDVEYNYKQGKEISAGDTVEMDIINTYKRKTGSLTIKKNVNGTSANDVFLFNVKGNNGVDMTVSVEGGKSVTIYDLPLGTYTVTENAAWSWRYALTTKNGLTADLTANESVTLEFINSYSDDQWLTDTFIKANQFTESSPTS